jgi:hypothetical protein
VGEEIRDQGGRWYGTAMDAALCKQERREEEGEDTDKWVPLWKNNSIQNPNFVEI